jgi:DNA-binding MarR family transcriptional regulator
MTGAKAAFAPLPARAIGDKRFSGLHFRVLACLAMHDRMSSSRGKGQGCIASNKTLAVECGCDYSRLSTTITDLGRFGYVEREQHPLNKRLRVYRVIYTDADIAFTKAANSLPTGKQPPDDEEQIVCEPAKSNGETVCRDFQESEQNHQGAEVNIFRETGKILGETLVRNPVETAPPQKSGSASMNVGAQLARFERAMKKAPIRDFDVGDLQRAHDWLTELFDTLDTDDPNHGRAQRLLEDIDWPEEVYSPSTDPAFAASGDAPRAMKEATERQRPCLYPTLVEAFKNEPDVLCLLEAMPADVLHEADRKRAVEGVKAAAAYLWEQGQ